MTLSSATRALGPIRAPLLAAAGLGALALLNHVVARAAERRHPPKGRFVEVDGVRLHYTDQGSGPPVLLVHGNAVSSEDWETSGVAALLRDGHRVIAFDRPGFGYSDRPRGRIWTAEAQAELLHQAMLQLGVERPVVVGHSWGAIVVLALATRHPAETAGVVLLSGYYFWTLRPDVLPVTIGAMPVLGDLLRYTVSPWLGRLFMPLLKRQMFSPQPVPPRFREDYSDAMALRPSQIRATAGDGALMIPGALQLRDRLGTLAIPTVIMAGAGDRVVFSKMAQRLHASMPASVLRIVRDTGHMVHYSVPLEVAAAVDAVGEAGTPRQGAPVPQPAQAA